MQKEKLQDEVKKESLPPPAPPGISLEEANDLKVKIMKLEREAYEMQGVIADDEDSKDEFNRKVNFLTHQLEDEKKWSSQLKKEFEDFRKKSLMESERAQRLAKSQLASLEKWMSEKLASCQTKAARRAQEEAELQQMRG